MEGGGWGGRLTRMYGTTLWRRVSSSHITATLLSSATARVYAGDVNQML